MHFRTRLFTTVATSLLLAGAPIMAAAQSVVSPAAADSDAGSFAPVIASSVRVLAMKADGSATYGTGWVITASDPQNRAGAAVVVTARHVVEGAVRVLIVESGSDINDQKPATVINAQVDQDIAFLEVKDLDKPALQISRAKTPLGDEIAAAGYTTASDRSEAEGRAKSATLKRGGISKYFRGTTSPQAQAPIDEVEFDAPVQAGFSGGPLLNKCGRVIGMTITDGGHIQIAEGANISTAQGVATAVAADEIIRAARAASVTVDAVDSACGGDSDGGKVAPPPPPPPPCGEPFTSVDSEGKACTAIQPTAWQKFTHQLKGPVGIVAAVGVLGLLLALIGTAVWYFRRKPTTSQILEDDYVPPARSGSDLLDKGSRAGTGVHAQSLRLTGRGPDGEPIDLRFSSDQLRTGPVTLGVEGDPNARIPDNRAKILVSRQHARIGFDGRNFTVEDNKSTNRTKVGQEFLEPFSKRVIVSGDTLTLADVSLHVSVE